MDIFGNMYKVSKLSVRRNFIVHFNGSTTVIYSCGRSYFFFLDNTPYLYFYYLEDELAMKLEE